MPMSLKETIAREVKSYFAEKNKKILQNVVRRKFYPACKVFIYKINDEY